MSSDLLFCCKPSATTEQARIEGVRPLDFLYTYMQGPVDFLNMYIKVHVIRLAVLL